MRNKELHTSVRRNADGKMIADMSAWKQSSRSGLIVLMRVRFVFVCVWGIRARICDRVDAACGRARAGTRMLMTLACGVQIEHTSMHKAQALNISARARALRSFAAFYREQCD